MQRTKRGTIRLPAAPRRAHERLMNPLHLRRIVLRWAPLVVAFAVIGALVAFVVTRNQPPMYEATGRVLVLGQVEASALSVTPDEIISTDAALMTQTPLLQGVIQDLHLNMTLDKLASEITVAPEGKTELIDVTVTDTDPIQAARIANAVVSGFVETAAAQSAPSPSTSPSSTAAPAAAKAIQVASPALPPTTPLASHRLTAVALGGFGGLLVGLMLALVLQYLDQGLVTEEDVRNRLGLPTLAVVPAFRSGATSAKQQREAGLAAEAYRRLRTGLLFSSLQGPLQTVVITSVRAGEGKTRTSANLAGVMAAAGERVLLVDADLRRPMQHRLFGEPLKHGTSELLLQVARASSEVTNGWRPTKFANLSLLSAGMIPPNPSELLASKTTTAVFRGLEKHFDLVVVDTPPAQLVTDALSVAASASATILVIEAGSTDAQQASHTIESLRAVGANVVGVVLNKARRRSLAAYSYYYYEGDAARADADEEPDDSVAAWQPIGESAGTSVQPGVSRVATSTAETVSSTVADARRRHPLEKK
jgi:succinoglycan biosynthesis transport protein ExoP